MLVDPRPLVAHVVYRFDTGGLENGVVNLINHMPAAAYRHAVIALTEVTEFRRRIVHDDVEFHALHKPPGHGVWLYPRLYRLFRRLQPRVVHSRNLAALETQVPAWAARIPLRIHGEHGWDVSDPHGSNPRYQRLRRFYRPYVHHYVALSRESDQYLGQKVHVPQSRRTQIYNGVDVARFHPAAEGRPEPIAGCPFEPGRHWLVGTVGRMQAVKDQPMLARAFVTALREAPALRERLRLVMVGDGPLREQVQTILGEAGVAELAWLPGERRDVPEILRGLHLFALPSLTEGISNTILEAMACSLPVVATAVGGNPDLVAVGETGETVPPSDPATMASCIAALAADPQRAAAMGQAGRRRVEQRFSLQAMVAAYQALYDRHRSPSIQSTRSA